MESQFNQELFGKFAGYMFQVENENGEKGFSMDSNLGYISGIRTLYEKKYGKNKGIFVSADWYTKLRSSIKKVGLSELN